MSLKYILVQNKFGTDHTQKIISSRKESELLDSKQKRYSGLRI